MDKEFLEILACPICGSRFELSFDGQASASSSRLVCKVTGHQYPVQDGIPRFVSTENYAESFGFQWKTFSHVQLDSYNRTNFSEERFRLITGWTQNDLAGKLVLDAGCGAGRFSEIALKYGAKLVAFDLSRAVEAWKDNLAPSGQLICQASIYELPFAPGLFDYVYCIGVVQHTPDPFATIQALCRMVKPGGQLALWIYERDWKSYLGTLGFKYALRPLFSRLSRSRQFSICQTMVNIFYPVAAFCKSRGLPGKIVMRLLPIAAAHIQSVPLSPADFKAWILLDTFDMYSPSYDLPQSYLKVANLLSQEKFTNIRRQPHGGIAITATRQV